MISSMMNICILACMVVLVAVRADAGTNTCVRACILGSDGSPTNCSDWLNRITSATTTDQNLITSSATGSVFSNTSTSTTTHVDIDTPTFATSNEDRINSQTPSSTRVITNTVISITNGTVSDAPSSFSSVVSNAETSATANPASTSIYSTASVVRSSVSSTARSATTVSTNLQDYNFLYGVEYGDSTITNVDDYCEPVPNSYHNLYVCSNGLVSLTGSYTYYTPSALTGTHGLSLVTPYHSDIDLRCEGCVLYYHWYDTQLHGSISNQPNVRTAEGLVRRLSRRTGFTALYLLIVTWDKVQHFPADGQNPSQRVSFQLVFASDGVNTYAVYKYFPGKMNFSGNYDVFIGYLLPPDIYVQHSLSFTTEALRIDQHVQTQGIQGILFYQLTGERIDTTNEEAFNYGTELGDQMFGDVDDRCVQVQNTYTFPLFNTLHSDLYVCSNGIVTIDGSHISPNLPSDLNSVEFDILMPYYTDIELKHNGVVYYQVTDVTKDDQFKEQENVIKAESYVRGLKTNARYFEAQFLLVVTWHRVTPYPAEARSNETMSFQLVLVSDGLETYVLYIYFENEMNLQENNALIGYMTRPGSFVQHLYSSTPLSRNVSSLLRTRNRRGAIFYELTEFPNEDNVFRHTCIKWYARNNAGRVIFNRSMSEMPDCPCTLDFLQRDRRFTSLLFSQGDAQCSYMRPSWWFRPLGVGKTCCYGAFSDQYFVQTGSYAGGFVRYTPWFFNTWHFRDDLQMREYCCEKTDLCHLYRALRPTGNCYTTFPVSFANFWGDPHIETLDGRRYTFNGYGEYTMLILSSGNTNFVLQARTSRAQKANGNFSDATIFSAFAAKDDRGVQAHVELNSTNTGLLIFAKTGSSEIFDDYTMSFSSEESFFAVDTENGSFFRENNRTAFTAVFSSGIFLTITLRHKMLSISVGIPSIFRGQTKGLLGNFDGDITNDFICANGTQLNNTITDREIFQFGESWTINGPDSVFRYPNGKHTADYSHRNFTPKFMDEADPLMVANAMNICGEENQECIFDLVFTENEEVANDTLRIQMEAEAGRRQIENVVPYIEGPADVEVTINTTLTYSISGTDDGTIAYRFLTNDIGAILQLNDSCGAFVSFEMPVDEPIELSVVAEDNNGVVSNICEPTIVFCSGCNNHGACDFKTFKDDNRTTTKFKYARCICNQYWSGPDCDEDFDSCADSPCSALRMCIDYPPTVHQQQGIGYSCSNCPGGYSLGGDGKCIDIDECSTMNGGCEQICQNTQGSYQCSCFSMFRIQSNGRACKDIDECEESLSDCDQICLNTNGSYNCSCVPGFEYDVISRTCVAVEPPSVCSDLNCSNSTGCTIDGNGNATCFCKIGYHLSADGSSCEDDDECIQNTCQQICTNTLGSFQCRCYAGFQMDNDKLTCKPCQPLSFGENCSQVCECSQGAERCDPVRGCICRTGWTGSACESDVDECRNPNICRDVLKSCVNTNGSYACTCVDGYTVKENNVCSDVDECNDPDLDVCEQECVNTAGGFYCTCEAGFILDPQNNTRCKDINECANGQSGCKHICENTPGRFSCDCYYGYRLTSDRKTCEQVENPCATLGNFNCSQICVVNDHSSFCSCNQGYQLLEDSQSCKDINECSTESLNQCSHKNRCLNNEGGYTCSCDVGFRLDKDGRTCHDCDDFHYGPDCSIPCNCGVGAVTCDPVAGCRCKNGWRGEKCTVDRNECNSIPSPCTGANALCINTNGSYICDCEPGFRNTSSGCEDINECEDSLLNDCEHVCVNKEGSYTCDCQPGFLQDEHHCHDINECAGQNNCSHSCENTHGGYRCACGEGFKLNLADKRTCIPKTLCQREAELACRIKGALCVEKHDATECYCDKGYAFLSNESCEDLNECENNTCHEICTNIPGGYICSCSTGKMIARDGKTCTDCTDGKYGDGCNNSCSCNNTNTEKCSKLTGECTCMPGWQGPTCDVNLNECLNNSTCPKDSVCINTKGSYLCICQAGFMMTMSGDCIECDRRHFGSDCAHDCTCMVQNTERCDKVSGNCTCIDGWAGQSCELKITSSTIITTISSTTKTTSPQSTTATLTTTTTTTQVSDDTTTLTTPVQMNFTSTIISSIKAATTTPEVTTAISNTEATSTLEPATNSSTTVSPEPATSSSTTITRTTLKPTTLSSTAKAISTPETATKFATTTSAETLEPTNTISTIITTSITEVSIMSTSTNTTAPEATSFSSSTTNTKIPHLTITSSTAMTTAARESPATVLTTTMSITPEQATVPSNKTTSRRLTSTTFSSATTTTLSLEATNISSAAPITASHEPVITSSTSATTKTSFPAASTSTTMIATAFEVTTATSATKTATTAVPTTTSSNTETSSTFKTSTMPSTTTAPISTTTSSSTITGITIVPTSPSSTTTTNSILEITTKYTATVPTESTEKTTTISTTTPMAITEPKSTMSTSTNTTSPELTINLSSTTNTRTLNQTTNSLTAMTTTIREPIIDYDLNECENNTCHEICMNILGGYICSCSTGKMIAWDGKTCTDCTDGKYGDGCNNSCSCNNTNTEKCSKLTGECTCMPGWQGPTCDVDLNECLNNSTCPKDSVCINTKGSYLCICQAGFMMTMSGDCIECDRRHFGADCAHDCTCMVQNTESCDKVSGNCTCIDGWAGQSCELKITSSTIITTISSTTKTTSPQSTTATLTTTTTTTQVSDATTTLTTPVQINVTSTIISSITAVTTTPEVTTAISNIETTTTLEPATNSSTTVSPEPATSSSTTITRTTLKPTTLSSTVKAISTPETATKFATTTSAETLEPTNTISTTVTTSITEASIMLTSTNTTAPEATSFSSSTTNTKIPHLTITSSTAMTTAAKESPATVLTTTMSITPEQATVPSTKTTTRRLTPTTFSSPTTTAVTLEATNISSAATIAASHEPVITSSTSSSTKTSDQTAITPTTTTATESEVTFTSSTSGTAPATTTSNTNTTTTLEPLTMSKNTTTLDPTSTSATPTPISILETKTKFATTVSTEGTEPTASVSTSTTRAITEPISIMLTSANTIAPGPTIISWSTTNTSLPDLTETFSTAMTTAATTLSTTTISRTPEQATMSSTTTTTTTLNPTTVSFSTKTEMANEATDTSSAATISARPEPANTSSTSATTKTSFPAAITSTTMIATPFEVTTSTSATKTAITSVPTTTPSNTETTATFETTTVSSTTTIPISTTTSSSAMTGTTLESTSPSSTTTTNSILDTTTKYTATVPTEGTEPATTISTTTTMAITEPNSTMSTSTNTTSPELTINLSSTTNTRTPDQTTNSLTAMTTTIREPTTTSLTTAISTTSDLATILPTTTTTTSTEKTTIPSTTITRTTQVVTDTPSSTKTIPATLDPANKSSTLEPSTEPDPGTITWNITTIARPGPATTISIPTTTTTTTPGLATTISTTTTTTTTTTEPTTVLSTTTTMIKPEASAASLTTVTTTTFKPSTSSSTTESIKTSKPIVTSSTSAPTLESTASSVTGGNNIMTNTTTPGPTTSNAASGTTTATPKLEQTTLVSGSTTNLQSTKTSPVTEVKTTKTPLYITTSVSNTTIRACTADRFGSKCENECQCKRKNAVSPNQTCSPTNGTCICKSGWTGDCGEDIDECAAETNICHDKPKTGCHNMDGGYRCSCLIGFEENQNGSCVDAAGKETTTVPTIQAGQLGTRCSITFNIQISVSINLNVRETYNHYEHAVRVTLEVFFASFLIQSSVQVIITSVRRGSLIVDYVLILENNEETKQQLTKAFEHLASGVPISIDGKNATAKNLSFGNVSISNGTVGLCFLYQEIYGGCPDSYECLVENQVPSCRKKKAVVTDSSAVIIGVGIGIPVSILSIVLVVMALYLRKRKRQKSKNLESEIKTSSFDLHRMTFRFKGRHGTEDCSFYGQWPNYNGSQRMWNEC